MQDSLQKEFTGYMGQQALIIGSSPAIRLLKKSQFEGIRIGVGDIPVRAPEFGPYDFWVTANTYFPLPWKERHLTMFNKAREVLVASIAWQRYFEVQPLKTWKDLQQSLQALKDTRNVVLYQQNHHGPNYCLPEESICCQVARMEHFGDSIQNLLSKLVGDAHPAYSNGSTVALHGYALAVLLRSPTIRIVGVDLPELNSSYRHYRNSFLPPETFTIRERLQNKLTKIDLRQSRKFTDFGKGENRSRILADFLSIAEIARSQGTSTFVLNSSSPLKSLIDDSLLR